MYTYYHKNKFLSFSTPLDEIVYQITINENDDLTVKYYMLTPEQQAFYELYPRVTFEEVLSQKINQNAQIKEARKMAYKRESDSLFIVWQKYLATGQTEKAEIAKQQWLEKIKQIEERYPYNK